MSYNGHANWATWEARNWFGESIAEIFGDAANHAAGEDQAREVFEETAKELIESALDADLRQNGLDSSMLGLAAEAGRIDYDDLFNTELSDNPDLFESDGEDCGEKAKSGPRM